MRGAESLCVATEPPPCRRQMRNLTQGNARPLRSQGGNLDSFHPQCSSFSSLFVSSSHLTKSSYIFWRKWEWTRGLSLSAIPGEFTIKCIESLFSLVFLTSLFSLVFLSSFFHRIRWYLSGAVAAMRLLEKNTVLSLSFSLSLYVSLSLSLSLS